VLLEITRSAALRAVVVFSYSIVGLLTFIRRALLSIKDVDNLLKDGLNIAVSL
jgi:hypothetical protein